MRVQRDVEQQVRLDQLQPLVHQGGAVDRDERAHRPGGVGQRLLGGHVGQLGPAAAAERTAGRGQHQPADLVGPPGPQALGQGRVLGVHRHDLPGPRALLDERAADDQRLLVGQRQRAAGVQGGQRGGQPGRAGQPVEDDVRGPGGHLGGGVGAGQHLRQPGRALLPAVRRGGRVQGVLQVPRHGRPGHGDDLDVELEGLLGEQVDARGRATTGGQAHHPEPVRVAPDHVHRLGADRARGPEQHDGAAGGHRAIVAHVPALCPSPAPAPLHEGVGS